VRGALRWFASHGVAANLLMVLILVGGALTALTIEQEVFPEVEPDLITVSVEYLGATPEEVEEGVCIKVEEAVQGLEGIERITSRAVRNLGTVSIEVKDDADIREVLDDVKAAVDAIDSFPEEAESPIVRELEMVRQVLSVAVSGPVDEATLRRLGERVRDELIARPGISRVVLAAARPYEISIEVSEQQLRRYGLTMDEVTAAVRASSLDLSGGSVKTDGGEILLRTKSQAYRQRDFEELVLRTGADGSRLLLGDVATIVDGFEDTGQAARFDGLPTVLVKVFRVGDERALDIAADVYAWVDEAQPRMPTGVELTIWQDDARVLQSRLDLLVRNGRAGLLLVFLTLALFLRLSLALWVAVGIPVCFLGAIWVMPALDVSINMISLFGFLMALGIVVDDAIVVGENVHRQHEAGRRGLDAALTGVEQVAVPVVFAVLTTVAAFSPLIGMPGTIGAFIQQLPLIVVPTLLFSLVESLFILPAHLRHLRSPGEGRRTGLLAAWEAVQGRVTSLLGAFIRRVYRPTLELAIEWRYLTISLALVSCLLTASLFGAGWLRFVFFPEVEADNVVSWLTMPVGTPDEVTAGHVRRIEQAALALRDEYAARDGAPLFRHVLASVGEQPFRAAQTQAFGNAANFAGPHLGEINVELVGAEERSVSSGELQRRWREAVGEIPGAVELVFSSAVVRTGEAINVELTGPSVAALRDMADRIKEQLRGYAGVYDIADSFRAGQQELRLTVTPEAEALGIDQAALARQVRQGFYGDEAQRIQRGRDEVKVMVRYPEHERRSLGDVEAMRIRLPGGVEAPLGAVATADMQRGDATIQRSDRRRSINVTADVDEALADPNEILADLEAGLLPRLMADHPGSAFSFEGEQREQSDTVAGLIRGFVMALLLIYGLLAIPFGSYAQPAIVMSAVPFGIAGAVWGHLLMGMNITVMSLFGVVALTGVLVNDSLVLVDYVNRLRTEGHSLAEAVRQAGPARFRAILLTSLTTFAGLTPLLLERSLQAQFLVPMAVSLGFGVMFSTFITLILVPCLTVILDDVQRRRRSRRRAELPLEPAPASGATE
jgi:multidrug efflux pump subunit AcrB